MPAELLQDFGAALRPRLAGELRDDAMTRALYATDASLYQITPLGVLFPRHADDVQAALEVAARFEVPLLPRGGGSSLAGQAVGTALVIDFSRHLNEIVELNEEEGWVRVQPGLVLDHLNAKLAARGSKWTVGPDPASSSRATLGGIYGNNSTGTHSILYGNAIRHVRAAEVLLAGGTPLSLGGLSPEAWEARKRRGGAEGRLFTGLDELLQDTRTVIERDTPRHWRRNNGYRLETLLDTEPNIARLLCGSEGTLAVATEITFSLVPRPQRTALGVVHFHTRRDSLQAVTTILETNPSAVELFDGMTIVQARKAPGFARRLGFIEGDPGGLLITEYYGETEAELKSKLDELERTLAQAGQGYATVRALTPEAIANIWGVRKESLGLIMSVKGDWKPVAFIEDAAVPVEHLAEYIDALTKVLEATNTKASMYAHASAGCLHVRPFLNTKDAAEVKKMRDLSWASMELVRQYGGCVSSEHADGLARSWLNEPILGKELYEANRRLKRLFDGRGLLNPGKVVDAPPMTEDLRLGPTYQTIPVIEELDWSEDGGFAKSVELCNGNGACRKRLGGTMCPSYMVTLEEEHSTRGRANALRSALSGALPPEEFVGERMYEVLDLCIECKACKAECPSNVDMAKMKTEWLSKYWATHRMPLRTRLFARLPRLTRALPARLARTVNWINRRPALRKAMEKTLGVSARRALPAFAPEPFTTWFAKQNWGEDGTPVVLFADTFNNYNHPATARAAAEFLRKTGHHVIVPDAKACCGRPLLSKGLIHEAQSLALRTVEQLYPYAAQGLPVVGLEPSCILTFVDEFLALLPGEPRAKKLAEVTLTFEQYVARLADAGAFPSDLWKRDVRKILLHGHCHQKALVGTGPAERCLSLPPGYTVEVVDSGCCGMAGAFGYEQEHYDISIAMAERRLAPTVRAAAEDTIIAAAGTSCRHQIDDLTGRGTRHPAEILCEALA